MVGLQVVLLGALPFLSPALWWSVRTTPPSHTSEVAPKWASGSTWFGKGKCWSEFLCLGGYLTPPRQVGGCAPWDALGRRPPADPRRWTPAGGPVAGAQSTKVIANQVGSMIPHVWLTTIPQVTGYVILRPLASTAR
jgi:hypothetical protein